MKGRRGRMDARSERGATLVFVCLSLVALLGMLALAIDLGVMYVARSEAQRIADSAALAGATTFMTSQCTGTGNCAIDEPNARQQAETVGNTNHIIGQQVGIVDGDITFTFPSPQEPQITVLVSATIPTFFARIFGIGSDQVSATATAEAFNPVGSSSAFTPSCLVPFIVPNCDPSATDIAAAGTKNPSCTGNATYFVNDTTGASYVNGVYPNGPTGATWPLHFGTGPSNSAGPSQWYLIAFGGSQSGAQLRDNIQNCVPPGEYKCGDPLQTMNGKKVGPVIQGVEALIDATGLGMNQGQDSIVVSQSSSVLPQFTITYGSNNPDVALRGTSNPNGGPSNSIVTAPIYDCPGCGAGSDQLPPGGTTVTIVGFMQLFIEDVEHSGSDVPVNAIIMGYYGCGSPSATPPPSGIVSGSFIPIRLIQHPG